MALKRLELHDEAEATANGVKMAVSGKAGVLLEVTGTFTATITVEGKVMNSWKSIDSYAMSGGGRSTTISSDGLYWVPAPGLKSMRARISAYTSGKVTVFGAATDVPYGPVPS